MSADLAHREMMEVLDDLKKISRPFERVMVFIDGGYLREICKKVHNKDMFQYGILSAFFLQKFNTYPTNPFQANLIRVYYYDAKVDEGHPDYESQREYFELIDDLSAYTVRLGKLVESSKKHFK